VRRRDTFAFAAQADLQRQTLRELASRAQIDGTRPSLPSTVANTDDDQEHP
jgi:hypothetical protein